MAKNSAVSAGPSPVASARMRTVRAAASTATPSGAPFASFHAAMAAGCTLFHSIGARAGSAPHAKAATSAALPRTRFIGTSRRRARIHPRCAR